jgi:hypothetical protein
VFACDHAMKERYRERIRAHNRDIPFNPAAAAVQGRK